MFRFALVIFLLTTGLAEADVTKHVTDADNPFARALDGSAPSMKSSVEQSEDVKSPLLMAHDIERYRYNSLYYYKYMGVPTYLAAKMSKKMLEVTARITPPPPPSVDQQGRPLWFDGKIGVSNLNDIPFTLLSEERFSDLERVYKDWSDPSELRADGRPKLIAFRDMLARCKPDGWKTCHDIVLRWRVHSPRSEAAALTEAWYWFEYAWEARGGGYADSVAADGWRLFAERLNKAEEILLQTKEFTDSSPLWYDYLLEVKLARGAPKQELIEIFRQSQARGRFLPIYFDLANALTPKWGGSWELVDAFAKDAVRTTNQSELNSLYARIYWVVSDGEVNDPNIFKYTLVNWIELKRGFEDMMRLYPHSAHNLNAFAVFACMADDKSTFQSARFLIGKSIVPDRWPSSYSLDLCEHKFALQPL